MTTSTNGHLQGINLRSFAEYQEAERVYLSLYVSSEESLNKLQQRAGRIRNMLEDSPEELIYFERNLALVQQWLEENGYSNGFSGNGLCIFACEMLDYIQGIELAVAPDESATQDTLRIGAAPYLRPLAELQDEFENFVVVAADNRATRIIQVAANRTATVEQLRGDIKNHVRKGGWSQQRYERRRDKDLLHYGKEINEVLAKIVRGGHTKRIVLLGGQEMISELENVLSPEVAKAVVASKATALAEAEQPLVEEAYSLFFEEERDEEVRLWERIKNEYLSDGLAATGATDVLDALKLGRAEALLLTRDAELRGTRCPDCENVMHGTPTTCQICGAKNVFEIDLVDEFVRQSELTDASVEFSDPLDGLTKAGDVAALLRY